MPNWPNPASPPKIHCLYSQAWPYLRAHLWQILIFSCLVEVLFFWPGPIISPRTDRRIETNAKQLLGSGKPERRRLAPWCDANAERSRAQSSKSNYEPCCVSRVKCCRTEWGGVGCRVGRRSRGSVYFFMDVVRQSWGVGGLKGMGVVEAKPGLSLPLTPREPPVRVPKRVTV